MNSDDGDTTRAPRTLMDNPTVVITGAAYGIGRGIATAFLRRNARVVLVDRDADGLAEAQTALSALGTVVTAVADVRSRQDMQHVRDVTLHAFGTADVVCANAGVTTQALPVWELSDEEWAWAFDVNVNGVRNAAKTFIPDMIERDAGHFVVTASMQGITTGRIGAYAASKHAAASMAESLYGDLRRRGSNVGVSCLCPSYTKNARVSHPDRVETFTAHSMAELSDAERAERAAVRAKLLANGLEAESVGQMVVDAVDDGTFWIVPLKASLARVTQRAEQIVDGLHPTVADT